MNRWHVCLVLAVAAFAMMLFANLAHPLLWQDEGETIMLAERVVEYGYPKVHGKRNVVNEFGPHAAAGVKESSDAYIGKTWGDFFFAVPGLLWARQVEDVYARTWRLRLPFAAMGALGVALMLIAVIPAVPTSRRLAFAALYFAVCAVSISLLLHLREARYYALLVFVLGALIGVHLRRTVFASLGWRAYTIAESVLLFLLYHVFFAAWFSVTAMLALDAAATAWRAGGASAVRLRRAAYELAPHALAAAAVVPCLVYFETFEQAAGFSRSVGLGVGVVLGNFAEVILHFVRHELLVAVALTRLSVWACGRGGAASLERTRSARRVSARLAGFALGYAAFACVNPLAYERYFVVLSPILTLLFLLDGYTLLSELSRRAAPGSRRRAAATTLAVLGLGLGGSVLVRMPEITGRLAEIREPVRGPLDFLVPWVLARYPDPERLVIATNYEAHPLMYYLGSHVIVGLSLNNIVAERALEPDLVVPRRGWPRSLVEIRKILSRGGYRAEELPVRDLHYNNIPSVGRFRVTPDPHRFRTPHTAPGERGLMVFTRGSGAPPPVSAPAVWDFRFGRSRLQ